VTGQPTGNTIAWPVSPLAARAPTTGTAGAGAGFGFFFAAETVRASTVADDAGSVSSLKDLVH
jgi:hypothetical protein